MTPTKPTHGTGEGMMMTWKSIETCPDNTTVLFSDGDDVRIGRMEHNCLRVDGTRQDHFWGGSFDDNNPPQYWMPLPESPNVKGAN